MRTFLIKILENLTTFTTKIARWTNNMLINAREFFFLQTLYLQTSTPFMAFHEGSSFIARNYILKICNIVILFRIEINKQLGTIILTHFCFCLGAIDHANHICRWWFNFSLTLRFLGINIKLNFNANDLFVDERQKGHIWNHLKFLIVRAMFYVI